MPRRHTYKQKHRSKKRKTRKRKSSPKEDVAIIKAARSAAGNTLVEKSADRVMVNPTTRNMQHFATMVTVTMRRAAVRAKSFTPSVNKKLESVKKGTVQNIFGCGAESALGKTRSESLFMVRVGTNNDGTPKCVSATSEEAKNVMLSNFKHDQGIKCSNIIPPFQSHSNCWFNTMFMSFFVSDKGRKFMRSFRQLMIEGKTIAGKNIGPQQLRNSLLLFNAAIEACYNTDGNASSVGLALNTNNIIGNIHTILGGREGIKDVDEYGNPYKFYRDLIKYLGGDDINMIKLDGNDVSSFLSGDENSGTSPDVVIVTLVDFPEGAQASAYLNKPQKVNYRGATYQLDSAIARDVSQNHFCCGITCNGREMLFDGSAFSQLSSRKWKSLINKDQEWRPNGSDKSWNFMKGYSMLLYYRIN